MLKLKNTILAWVVWVIGSVDNQRCNIVEYFLLSGGSYIKLPPELQNSAKGLINLKNNDNECFLWCHVRHMCPKEKHDPRGVKKSDRLYLTSWIIRLLLGVKDTVDVKQ